MCLHTVSEAKITFVLLLYPPPPPTPAPTPLFNDISYLRVVPIRNLLFIGAFSLFHQFILLSFFVPCTLEVISGMLPGFCISPGKKCPSL